MLPGAAILNVAQCKSGTDDVLWLLRFESPCIVYCVYFRDEIQFNGELTDSSFRGQLEPEYSSCEERRENQYHEEEERNSLLANLGAHDLLPAFVIDISLLCQLTWNFLEESSVR